MGFGFLLVGYMFAFLATAGMGPYIFGGILVGSIFMFFGLKELKKYSPVFLYAFIGDILLFSCSLLGAAVWALGNFNVIDQSIISTVSIVYQAIKLVVALYFEISMLYGIVDLSRRVDYTDTRKAALTNMIYVGVFYLCQLICTTPLVTKLEGSDKAAVMTIMMIAQIVYTAINSFLLFKCYAMICPAGQEDMPRKPSRFAFINKIREIRDAKDEKAIEEMKNYYEDKLKKKNSKKKSKKKKKR